MINTIREQTYTFDNNAALKKEARTLINKHGTKYKTESTDNITQRPQQTNHTYT